MVGEKSVSVLSYPKYFVFAITVFASFFSFLHIGQKSIWLDEALSIYFAKLPWGDFWAVLSTEELHQGLYYILLKFWFIFGDSEFVVRALSALFSIASIPVLYALACRLFDTRAGLISVLLLSVNTFFVEYAQEGRGYSLVFFLVVLSSYLFIRVIDDSSSKKMLIGYVSISVLAVYAHLFGALVLIAQNLSMLFLPLNKFRIRRLLLANLLIAALITPIIFFFLFKNWGETSWIPKPSVSLLIGVFRELAGDAGHSRYITSFILLSCVISLSHAFVTLVRTGRSVDSWRYVFIFFWLAVPVCLLYGFSFIKPVFLKRYLIISLPGLVLLSGIGLALIKDKYCSTILIIILVILSVRSILTEYYPKEKENFRDATSYIANHAQSGDAILFFRGTTMIPFEYYLRRFNTPMDLLNSVYPSKLGNYNYLEDIWDPSVLTIKSLKEKHERVWVLSRYIPPKRIITLRSILTTLEEDYQIREDKYYTDVHVLLFVRK